MDEWFVQEFSPQNHPAAAVPVETTETATSTAADGAMQLGVDFEAEEAGMRRAFSRSRSVAKRSMSPGGQTLQGKGDAEPEPVTDLSGLMAARVSPTDVDADDGIKKKKKKTAKKSTTAPQQQPVQPLVLALELAHAQTTHHSAALQGTLAIAHTLSQNQMPPQPPVARSEEQHV